MARTWFGIAVVAVLSLLTVNAAAQKYEIAGSIGRMFVSDQGVIGANPANPNVHFGDGLTYEANASRRIFDIGLVGIAVEVPFVFTPTTDLNFGSNLVPKSFRSYFVTPAARIHLFPDTGISPWVSVGGGFGHFSESSELEFGGTNPGSKGSSSGVFQAGVGFDVKVIPLIKIRAEFRDFYSGVPQLNVNTAKDRQHNMFVGAGVVFSF
ncbi:MAG TPA: hypothetical protein VGF08_07140 [Terriglobales bacterium]|jgi:hypothetical protein